MPTLQHSDQLVMVLVIIPLNDSNYLSWSKFIMIALKTKDKLCFINAKCAKPEPYYENYEK